MNASLAPPPSLLIHYLVHDVARLQQVLVDISLRPFNVTRAQWQVLMTLAQHREEPLRQITLAAALGVTKVAAGAVIDRLESKGLVARVAYQNDRRVNCLELTRAGARLPLLIQESAEALSDLLFSACSEHEVRTAEKALRLMKINLKHMSPTPT